MGLCHHCGVKIDLRSVKYNCLECGERVKHYRQGAGGEMEAYYLSPKATKKTGSPGTNLLGTPGGTSGQHSPPPRSSPAPGGSTSPAVTPEDILQGRIERAEAKRALLVRKSDLLALEARLHELDIENQCMER